MSFSTLRGHPPSETSEFLWNFDPVRHFLYNGDETSNLDQDVVEKLELELKRLKWMLKNKCGEFYHVLNLFQHFLVKVCNNFILPIIPNFPIFRLYFWAI